MKSRIKIINEVVIRSIRDTEDINPIYSINTFTFKYDQKGRKIEKTKNESLLVEYIYDEKGNLIESKTSGGKYIYRNDNNGNRTSEHFLRVIDRGGYPISPELVSLTSFYYDEKNNCTEEKKIDEWGGPMYHFTYRYDNFGNKIEKKEWVMYFNDTDGPVKTIKYNYNDKRDCIEIREYNSSNELISTFSYVYQYDKTKVDWVKCMKYVQGVFTEIIGREIEYEIEYKVDPTLPF